MWRWLNSNNTSELLSENRKLSRKMEDYYVKDTCSHVLRIPPRRGLPLLVTVRIYVFSSFFFFFWSNRNLRSTFILIIIDCSLIDGYACSRPCCRQTTSLVEPVIWVDMKYHLGNPKIQAQHKYSRSLAWIIKVIFKK